MKAVLLLVPLLFATAVSALGETLYVTDVFDVMVRTGPTVTNKIIAMPKSGTPVEILELPGEERSDQWVRVRLPDDKEGWMLSQYLIPGPPKQEIIGRLERENQILGTKAKALGEENARLKTERAELEKELGVQTKTGNSLAESYETLKRESQDFLALKVSHEKATQDLALKTTQVEALEKEVTDLRNSQTLRWFVAGASIILVGFVIGFISRRPKKRPSLL
jgi:SH3 domain protein